MKRVTLLLVLAAAGLTASGRMPAPSSAAKSDACALPASTPVWIDFADGSVPFWQEFAQPGVVAAASNFIFPPQLRARGAKTVYWDMNLRNRVGTPNEPADPGVVVQRANRLYTYAAMSMGCAQPVMAENELFGAGTLTPWSASNTQYRADVLLFLQTLAARGAKPALLVNSTPFTGGDAADWWRQVSQVAQIVREAYFPAPAIYKLGVILGSRTVRQMFRAGAEDFISIGIPPAKLGLMLGFQTTPGFGGRERLQPASAWFEVTKLQTLAAQTVARELHLATLWSWGWGVWSVPESDPDKPAAACVYLWTRDPRLCNAPALLGPSFDASRTEGQLLLPSGSRCTVYGHPVRWDVAASISAVTQDPQSAFTAAYTRAVASSFAHISTRSLLSAEQAVIALHFRGSRAAYTAALARDHASVGMARGVIGDELRRSLIQSRLSVAGPSASQIQSYYDTYAAAPVRLVQVKPAAPWLENSKRGFALGAIAPPQVFGLATGQQASVRTMTGSYKVRALGPTLSLAELPLAVAAKPIATALVALARDGAYQNWLLDREQTALNQTLCWRDQLPAVEVVPLTDYLPYLALDSGSAASSSGLGARR
ncbi:MAG TPA: hypothetical protein VF002_05330 [Gaiellaceae bacterium]